MNSIRTTMKYVVSFLYFLTNKTINKQNKQTAKNKIKQNKDKNKPKWNNKNAKHKAKQNN